MPYKLPSFEIQALIKTAVDSIKTVVDGMKRTTDVTKTIVDSTKKTADTTKIVVDGIKETTETTKTVVDGMKRTTDATKTVVDGMKRTTDATKTEVDGMKSTIDTTKTVVEGMKRTIDTTKTVVDGMKRTTETTKTVVDGMKRTTETTKTVVDGIKGTTDRTKTVVENLINKQDSLLLKIQNGDLKRNIAVFDMPGTYSWACPEGVTVIVLTMFGAGGSGGVTVINNWRTSSTGGYGGASVRRKPIKVTPRNTYRLVVGRGGTGLTNISTTIAGNAGGATSGFGIVCNGGAGGLQGAVKQATGNSPLCNKGTTPHFFVHSSSIVTQSTSALFDKSSTIFGLGGSSNTDNGVNFYGGGAGFGDGGDAGDTSNTVAPGAGSGAGYGLNSGTTIKGGDGIIIIEY
ncbi:hypothetical protein FH508_0012855 [Lysinibacillus sp. CD3-6]|uniref:glycine-rich domain-containing protein n=1 Tax=Lysinibacillus sp. CD3-6 TaxID=2892541 RepID=UPI00116D08DA|nr:hypothetical protein [Lysinibacillus sp. CD3-6]UED78355.1 hypothetical protein FH508_0012855 [Lysinibacillus sp. CD3-6]